jgi:hypothetical protein
MSLQEDGEDAEHVGVTLAFQLLIVFAFLSRQEYADRKITHPSSQTADFARTTFND